MENQISTFMQGCIFCKQKYSFNQYPSIILNALQDKYSQSQNFFYGLQVAHIMQKKQCHLVIIYNDYLTLDYDDEYLKKYYPRSKLSQKFKCLQKYYQFHIDIPRLFMKPQCETILVYQQEKRRILYKKITKMFKSKQKEQMEDKKPSQDDSHQILNSIYKVSFQVLKEVSDSNQKNEQIVRNMSTLDDIKQQLSRIIQSQQESMELTQNMSIGNLNNFQDYVNSRHKNNQYVSMINIDRLSRANKLTKEQELLVQSQQRSIQQAIKQQKYQIFNQIDQQKKMTSSSQKYSHDYLKNQQILKQNNKKSYKIQQQSGQSQAVVQLLATKTKNEKFKINNFQKALELFQLEDRNLGSARLRQDKQKMKQINSQREMEYRKDKFRKLFSNPKTKSGQQKREKEALTVYNIKQIFEQSHRQNHSSQGKMEKAKAVNRFFNHRQSNPVIHTYKLKESFNQEEGLKKKKQKTNSQSEIFWKKNKSQQKLNYELKQQKVSINHQNYPMNFNDYINEKNKSVLSQSTRNRINKDLKQKVSTKIAKQFNTYNQNTNNIVNVFINQKNIKVVNSNYSSQFKQYKQQLNLPIQQNVNNKMLKQSNDFLDIYKKKLQML